MTMHATQPGKQVNRLGWRDWRRVYELYKMKSPGKDMIRIVKWLLPTMVIVTMVFLDHHGLSPKAFIYSPVMVPGWSFAGSFTWLAWRGLKKKARRFERATI